MSMAWEPDRRSNFFFNPPAHLCAVTYMTEISLTVTLNNKFTSPHLIRVIMRIIRVITRNIRVITRNLRVIVQNIRVIVRNIRVITRNICVNTRNIRVITRNIRVITRNIRVITRKNIFSMSSIGFRNFVISDYQEIKFLISRNS